MRSLSLLITSAILAMATPLSSLAQSPYTVESPDRRVRLEVTAREGMLSYAVVRDGVTVISPSPLGLVTSKGTFDGNSMQVKGTERKTMTDIYRPVVGKASSVPDHYNQLELTFAGKSTPTRLHLIARAYDEGIAFRYVLPQQSDVKDLNIISESTGFFFPDDYRCWGFNPGRY